MCDPVTAGLILTAVGGGAKAINTRQTGRRQDRELAAGIRRQGEIGRKSAARTQQEIADVAASGPEGEQAEALQGFMDALRANQDLTDVTQPGVPQASERFAEDLAGARAGVRTRAGGRADLLSRIDAPFRQRQRESVGRGRLATDIGRFQDRSTSADFLARLRASEQRNNPFIDIAGSILQGVGGGIAGGGLPNFLKGGTNLPGLVSSGSIIDPILDQGLPDFLQEALTRVA